MNARLMTPDALPSATADNQNTRAEEYPMTDSLLTSCPDAPAGTNLNPQEARAELRRLARLLRRDDANHFYSNAANTLINIDRDFNRRPLATNLDYAEERIEFAAWVLAEYGTDAVLLCNEGREDREMVRSLIDRLPKLRKRQSEKAARDARREAKRGGPASRAPREVSVVPAPALPADPVTEA